jgi:hypothetical protein
MLVGPGIIQDSDLWAQTIRKLEEMLGKGLIISWCTLRKKKPSNVNMRIYW